MQGDFKEHLMKSIKDFWREKLTKHLSCIFIFLIFIFYMMTDGQSRFIQML